MKLRYSKLSCTDLENKLGLQPNTIEMTPCPDGTVELEIKGELTATQLALLNKQFPNHQRVYTEEAPFQEGEIRDLEAEIDALKAVPYAPLPGTGLPEKIAQIEDFLGQVFKA